MEVVAADLSRLDEVERVAREAIRRLGRLDVLVNNAGAIKGGDFLSIPESVGSISMLRRRLPLGSPPAP